MIYSGPTFTEVHMKARPLLLVMLSFVPFVSCTKKSAEGSGRFTYTTTTTAPQTWNPTDWGISNEGTILSFTSSGLYTFVLNETRDGSVISCELAADFPQDVTAEYAGNPLYGIPSDATAGYAWRVPLRHDALWEDGTAITADTWDYSLRQFLNPQMKNYRASNFYQGSTALANAEAYYNGTGTWDDVGFVKNDDYTVTFIFTKALSEFFFEYGMSGPTLVHPDLYEANKKQTGDIIKSAYGTKKEFYASHGPYKITTYQPEKEMLLERNENWFGWHDPAYKDQYQTTHISLQFIESHSTALSLFLQGKIDDVSLSGADYEKYRNSDFILYTPTSYTVKLTLNSDWAALKKEETKGINHTLLSYIDFRHALSLSIDRQKYIDSMGASSDPGYALLNYLYVADPENGTLFRDTPQAEQAQCELYGTSSVDDITGYDRHLAAQYFQMAYDKALAAGDIKPGDKVQIDFHTYNDEEGFQRAVNFFRDSINEASKGTSLEGRITIKQIADEDFLRNMVKGAVDCGITGWGGGSYDPYGVLWCYCDPSVCHEYGLRPETKTLTIEIDGTPITKTYYEWYIELNEGTYAQADYDTRNLILARCEQGLLGTYTMIPLTYSISTSLYSQRTVEGSEDFVNTLVDGYGGLRFMTYTMDDAEWADYCAQNNNQLTY